ncbi:CDP-diacylglycerol--glycerol-3-phosphate 3-phosphatidyltransferase [Agaribacterium sp. ZY112]|uniref:CDP-diacylglycerol--glycerol-3-phosphate 3-phosphatidyltransferase n=1 Tax=Agaribacterium sp. ZY112 TaxID=3233574 RepID=UPI0035253693
MSLDQSINLQSLNMVRDELVATVDSSAKHLEEYVRGDCKQANALTEAVKATQQIIGTFTLLELNSAGMLAEELSSVLQSLETEHQGKRFDSILEVTTNTFFILPRYLEYLNQVQQQVPGLLIPHINALRKLQREQALTESHFLPISVPQGLQAPPPKKVVATSEGLVSQVRRARQMYQLGLLALIKEKQVKQGVSLMRKGLARVWNLSGEQNLSTLWWLADVALEALIDADMSPLETRKFIFMYVDKVFRQVELQGEESFQSPAPKVIVKELLYLITLSGHKSEACEAVHQACPELKLPYTERELQKEYAVLYGPSSHTINTLAQVLHAELTSAKRTLEGGSQNALAIVNDLDSFVSILNKIGETLSIIGLNSASQTLKTQLDVVKGWSDNSDSIDEAELDEVANCLLYIESLVANLQHANVHGDHSSDVTTRDQQVISHELSSALAIVREECLSGLSLTKRALNSFSSSGYDTGHIINIAKTLDAIRGAMQILGLEKASSLLQRSSVFVDEVLLLDEPPAAIDEVLETFADAIISIEYYFDSTASLDSLDDKVLNIAEESLNALGYGL